MSTPYTVTSRKGTETARIKKNTSTTSQPSATKSRPNLVVVLDLIILYMQLFKEGTGSTDDLHISKSVSTALQSREKQTFGNRTS